VLDPVTWPVSGACCLAAIVQPPAAARSPCSPVTRQDAARAAPGRQPSRRSRRPLRSAATGGAGQSWPPGRAARPAAAGLPAIRRLPACSWLHRRVLCGARQEERPVRPDPPGTAGRPPDAGRPAPAGLARSRRADTRPVPGGLARTARRRSPPAPRSAADDLQPSAPRAAATARGRARGCGWRASIRCPAPAAKLVSDCLA
jgi:hypothetical protein